MWGGVDFADRSRERFLSRRDEMIVAWQFTAWDAEKNRTVPLGNGMIGSAERSATLSGERPNRPSQTVPYGTGLFL